jgi:hypothetical protein
VCFATPTRCLLNQFSPFPYVYNPSCRIACNFSNIQRFIGQLRLVEGNYSVSTKSLRGFEKLWLQIKLAIRGLRQIIVKLWKFLFPQTNGISGHFMFLSQLFVKWRLCRGSAGTRVPRRDISRKMDRQRWSNALASTFTTHNTSGFFPCGVMSRATCSEH